MHLNNVNRIMTLVVLYTAVGGLIVPSLQSAWSDPGPTRTWRIDVVEAGEQSVDLIGLAGFVPHEGSIWITEPGITPTFPTSLAPTGAWTPVVGTPTMLGAGPYNWKLIQGTGSFLMIRRPPGSAHLIVGTGWKA